MSVAASTVTGPAGGASPRNFAGATLGRGARAVTKEIVEGIRP